MHISYRIFLVEALFKALHVFLGELYFTDGMEKN